MPPLGKALTAATASSAPSGGSWLDRLTAVGDTVAWVLGLQLAWLLGVLAGGVVLGVGPATLAAAAVVRRREREGSVALTSAFAAAYRANWGTGQRVVLPVLAVGGALGLNYLWWSAQGVDATMQRLLTVVGGLLVVAVLGWLPALVAHYDLTPGRYPLTALRLVLARPLPTLLLMLVTAAVVTVSAVAPPLLLTAAVGAWLHSACWLSLRFFAHNEQARDDARAERVSDRPEPTLPALPREPMRLH